MKNLNKKIGVMVLSGAVLMGGFFASAGSSYASSVNNSDLISEQSGKISRKQENYINYMYLYRGQKDNNIKVLWNSMDPELKLSVNKEMPIQKLSNRGKAFESAEQFFQSIKRIRLRAGDRYYLARIGDLSFLFEVEKVE